MTTLGPWHYPLNPLKTIPDFDKKPQFKMSGREILKMVDKRLDTDEVTVSEEVALSLAAKSPNPQKAANAVYLLTGAQNLKLLPLAALLFASARR